MSILNNWLKYYRASLIDSGRGEKQLLNLKVERSTSFLASLEPNEIKDLWGKNNTKENAQEELTSFLPSNEVKGKGDGYSSIKEKEASHAKINKFEVAPIYLTSVVEHGAKIGGNKIHYPFWVPFYVDETGNLYPPKNDEKPAFIRGYLEPNPQDLPAIAQMDRLDKILRDFSFNTESWSKYWKDCERFFKNVTGKRYLDFHQDGRFQFSFSNVEDNNSTKQIIKLYDDLIAKSSSPSTENQNLLLNKVLDKQVEVKNHLLSKTDIYLNPDHYGQMGKDFPLSKSQRVAFAQFFSKKNKKAFAINGPPGTGKTTILQSIIANYVVKHVIEGKKPFLMAGCSTNNQAITNILDSMAIKTDNLLTTRWIPDTNSFGLYLCASSKGNDAAEKGYQFVTKNYLNDGYLDSLEDPSRIQEYLDSYNQNFKSYFKDIEVQDHNIKEFLFIKINEVKAKIDIAIKITKDYLDIELALKEQKFEDYVSLCDEIMQTQQRIDSNKSTQDLINTTKSRLHEKYEELPFHMKYAPVKKFKSVKKNSFKVIVQPIIGNIPQDVKWHDYHGLQSIIDHYLLQKIEEHQAISKRLESLKKLKEFTLRSTKSYRDFFSSWDKAYSDRWNNLLDLTGDEYQGLDIIETVAVKLDISYRHDLFWLSVHYREYEYILEFEGIKDYNGKERGQKSYKDKLHRLAKITPLFISTFHTLPHYGTYYEPKGGEKFYNELFDLMVVDEAGQVSPEVAIPSLSLSKRILTVGDIYQIEPIWGVTKSVDYINAEKYTIVKSDEDFEQISSLGFTSSSGSLMKLVRKATPFSFKHQSNNEEKGAYLTEHRRCIDGIIQFSNEYIYNQSLKLKGGAKHNKSHNLPPLGYVHINGSSEKHIGSSRKNIIEANAIIQWLRIHEGNLKKAYPKKPLDEIVAIVTPFSAQKLTLKQLINKNFEKNVAKRIVVGTVHALQGAERPVILFSSVHDTEDSNLFFDYENKYNMLNVALTRAKHSFILFSNMGIFNPSKPSPSGALSKLLFSDDSYRLNEKFLFDSENVYQSKKENKITRISTLVMHRKTLNRCFKSAEKELVIFSPFISINAIREDDVIALIQEAVDRGVKITILTDKSLDIEDGKLKVVARLGREAIQTTKVSFKIVNGIHNKTICVDNKVLIEGSFNWLSATRDTSSAYFREETSLIIQGEKIEKEIEEIKRKFI